MLEFILNGSTEITERIVRSKVGSKCPMFSLTLILKEGFISFLLMVQLKISLTNIAKSKKVPSDKFINTWLREKLQEQMKKMKEEAYQLSSHVEWVGRNDTQLTGT